MDHTYAQQYTGCANEDHSYALGSKDSSTKKTADNKLLPQCSSWPHQSAAKIGSQVYRILDVPGDGNCFFASISLFLYGSPTNSHHLRQLICTEVYTNWDMWGDAAKLHHDAGITQMKYMQTMIIQNGWATGCEIAVASSVLNVDIVVHMQGSRVVRNQRIPCVTTETFHAPQIAHGQIMLLLTHQHFRLLQCTTIEELLTRYQQKRALEQEAVKNKVIEGKRPRLMGTVSSATVGKSDNQSKDNELHENLSIVPSDSELIDEEAIEDQANEVIEEPTSNVIEDKYLNLLLLKADKICVKYDDIEKNVREIAVGSDDGTDFRLLFPLLPKKDKQRLKRRLKKRINRSVEKFNVSINDVNMPQQPENAQLRLALEGIRRFELEQMAYTFNCCSICKERRLDNKLSPREGICSRCRKDRDQVKMFSTENKMDPGPVPSQLQNLTLIEEQMICRLAPAMSIHLLKHGGLGSAGHCVTFPQEIDQPAQIFPRLPSEISLIRMRRIGRGDTTKDFTVRRYVVQEALQWLKSNNPAYKDIIISESRLSQLPINGEIEGINTLEHSRAVDPVETDLGPAEDQVNPGEISDGETVSGLLLPEPQRDIRQETENVVKEILGDTEQVEIRRGKPVIPWPTRQDTPVSEFTTNNFFTLAFPVLFPTGAADFRINRPRTCESMTEWAEHLLWYTDGRFAKHKYFKFVVHNIIMRKRSMDQSTFIMKQALGEELMSVEKLKEMFEQDDLSAARKVISYSGSLRGTTQYWARKAKELRSLIQFQINSGNGLPSFFTTGSCAEFYFKPLKRLLTLYIQETTGMSPDLDNKQEMFHALQENTHIIGHYFELRTKSYFRNVMENVFNVNTYWYRYEFAKSRGMIHWHGLCWRADKEPHQLLYEAVQNNLTDVDMANELAKWAKDIFGMTAEHPAGKDDRGNSRKDLWPPPEGFAEPCADEDNPLFKLLMDLSNDQSSLLEDYIQLCNKVCLHSCSSYCLTKKRGKGEKQCRMEFGTVSNPGKPLRVDPEIVKDRNQCLRLEMARDHPRLVQNSQIHTQGWRANGDISIILSKSNPNNPSVKEILAAEKYVSGYACKGNEPTGAVADIFKDLVDSADETSDSRNIVTKVLMRTVKRDISAVEASYELSGLPLFQCSHRFKNISLTGFRVLEQNGCTATKQTPLDHYLSRKENDKSSLYQFVCNQGYVPVISGIQTYQSWPLSEDYAKKLLLLHWPNWRKIDEITEGRSWTEKMNEFYESEDCPNYVKAEVDRCKEAERVDNGSDAEDSETEEDEVAQPSWCELIRPNANFDEGLLEFKYDDGGPDYDWSASVNQYSKDFGSQWFERTMAEGNIVTSNLLLPEVELSSLNEEQRLAFNIIMDRLIMYKNSDPKYTPLRMVIAGAAGSGKSYLINCIVKAARMLFSNNRSVQVVCPTGSSANLIGGVTLHSYLKVPTGKNTKKEMENLEGDAAEVLQENCRDLLCLLTDERSLVGCNTLGWMEFRTKQGKQSDDSWGGLPVVVFLGDDIQLPPVLDSPVYMGSTTSPASIHGTLVWKEFDTCVKLTTVVRQNVDQDRFKQVLGCMRSYDTTSEDVQWLQQFQWQNLQKTHGIELLRRFDDFGLFVFPTHAEEWSHNKDKLLCLNEQYPIAKLNSETKGVHKSSNADKAGGLQKQLFLCVNARVMLTVNLQVKYGLFNGSVGIVRDIVYAPGNKPPEALPDMVLVEFPKYCGPPFIKEYPARIPIHPVRRRLDCGCCSRLQIPLRLGWGTTIHRCQGMTIGEGELNKYVVVSPGSKRFEANFPGALYVALSRAKTAGGPQEDPGFAFHKSVLLNEDRLCYKNNTKKVLTRKAEIERLNVMADNTTKEYENLNSLHAFTSIERQICDCYSFEE